MGDLPDFQTRISTGDDDVLFTGTFSSIIAPPVMDVSAYASLQLFITSQSRSGAMDLFANWLDTNGDPIVGDQLTAYPAPFAVTWPSMQVPVRAPKVFFETVGPDDLQATILGSQRPLDRMLSLGYTDHSSFINSAAAMVAGTFYDVGATPYLVSQGQHQLELALSNSAVTGGLYLAFDVGAGSNVNTLIADTAEGVTDAGVRIVSKQVILPASLCRLRFLCRTAGSSSVGANFISLGH